MLFRSNRVQIVDIEADRNSGSVRTLRKLADALGVTVDDLVPSTDHDTEERCSNEDALR